VTKPPAGRLHRAIQSGLATYSLRSSAMRNITENDHESSSKLKIDEVLAMLENVKKTANGWSSRCPAHTDNSKDSLSIKEGDDGKILLYCFGGCALDAVIGAMGIDAKQLFPEKQKKSGPRRKIVKTYDYLDLAGNLLYQAVRYEPKDFSQRQADQENPGKWIWNLKGIKPTLYRLSEMLDSIKAGHPVCIAEGEKDVENLADIGVVATCNSGGAEKWSANFTQYFTGANVVLFEDNDKAGRQHVEKVGKYLAKVAAEVKVVRFPDEKEHYDISDWLAEGNGKDELVALVTASPLWEPSEELPEDDTPKITTHADPTSQPFRFLGFNNGRYHYLPDGQMQIRSISEDQHTPAMLMGIAPLQWYEMQYPNGNRGPDWNAVKNWMFRMSEDKGVFNPKLIRGRGAWYDDGRVVQHLGSRLIVDGIETGIKELDTQYIYNASRPIEILREQPLKSADAVKFLNMCRMLTWEKEVSGTLLAGFCVIAPLCGAWNWRPHIWITGSSDSGKSTVMTGIIWPMIGDIALRVQSNTTEAGVRQSLGSNALPVIFDEIEGESKGARDRVQHILELMRQASSEDGAPIVKGSSSGHAVEYMIRSCFVLSSIGVNIKQKADASRVSVLSLVKQPKEKFQARYDEIKAVIAEVTTKEWCAALRVRTLNLMPIILKNTETFSRVVAKKFGTNRIGDQLGVILAGAYSLTSDKTVSAGKATEWVDEQDWSEQSSIDEMTDEEQCKRSILEHGITYQVSNTRVEKTIGEILYHHRENTSPDTSEALERIGIKMRFNKGRHEALISDSHKEIRNILRDTPWENGWGRILKRLDGAKALPSVSFHGIYNRVTAIPFSVLFDEDGEQKIAATESDT
jgi:putative DNA primase/helicase